MRYLTIIFVILALPRAAGAQAVTFEREGVEYRLELPSPAWRAVRRVDVHDHYNFVNGEGRADGYLRIRRSLVEAGTGFASAIDDPAGPRRLASDILLTCERS